MADKEVWYHDSVSRKDAENKLYNSGKNGAFLVRKSDTVPGAYVLSLHVDKFIHHYRIKLCQDGFYVTVNGRSSINSMKFESLPCVIKYLMMNPDRINMAGPLVYPIAPEVDDEEEDESDDELEGGIQQQKTTLIDETCYGGELETLETGGMELIISTASRELVSQLQASTQQMMVLDRLLVSHLAVQVETEVDTRLLEELQTALHESSKITMSLQSKLNINFARDNAAVTEDTKLFETKDARGKLQIAVGSKRGTVTFGKEGETEYIVFVESIRTPHQLSGVALLLAPRASGYSSTIIKRLDKSSRDDNKMTINFTDRKTREVQFEDTRTREHFFQTISQLKIATNSTTPHKDTNLKNLSVFCVTWNMGEVEPVGDISGIFDEVGEYVVGYSNNLTPTAYDIYVIGTQEANIAEKEWANCLRKYLSLRNPSCQYSLVSSQTLSGIRIVVLIKSRHYNNISCVETSSVKTGVGGMVGNKGGVAVSFLFNSTHLAFVCAHLAARAERKLKRNQMYHDISRQLNIGRKSKLASFDLPYRFDHVFWVGDLNYRLDCEYQEVLRRTAGRDFAGLLQHDQLTGERERGQVFYNFREGPISFPPSYRYRRGSRDQYIYIKYKKTGNVFNVPSYCDRVLTHSLPKLTCRQTGYFCNLRYPASDHAPVIATYQVATRNLCVPVTVDTLLESSLKIRFPIVQARIKSLSQDRFYLKFFSVLLEGVPCSKPAPRLLAEYSGELRGGPEEASLAKCDISFWTGADLPVLEPLLPNRAYLAHQTLHLQVLAHGSEECYGQGVVPLRDIANADQPAPFRVLLTLGDEVCGEVRGRACLSNNPPQSPALFSDQLCKPQWSRPSNNSSSTSLPNSSRGSTSSG